MNDMLQDCGNPWRGMVYGMTARLNQTDIVARIHKVLKDFGIYKTVTSKDPIDMAIGLAMMEEGEIEEEEEYNRKMQEELDEIIEKENEDDITADDILEKIKRNQKDIRKNKYFKD